MTFALVKLPNEPIVIVTGDIPVEENLPALHAMFGQVDRLASQTGGLLYCILDTRHLENLSFSDILLWLDEQRTAPPGSARDSRLRMWGVGTHSLLPIAVKKLRQQYGVEMMLADTLDAALARIRAELAGC